MRGKSGHTPLQEANNIKAEAIHRAALNLDQFMDGGETASYKTEVYRHLAKEYNKMLDNYRLDGLAMNEVEPPWGVIV
jgi:hypothetical protein